MIVGAEVGSNLEQLRAAATDTVEGMPQVFGQIRDGRIASKLKFKVVKLRDGCVLLVFASDQRVLDEARLALKGHRSKPEDLDKRLSCEMSFNRQPSDLASSENHSRN